MKVRLFSQSRGEALHKMFRPSSQSFVLEFSLASLVRPVVALWPMCNEPWKELDDLRRRDDKTVGCQLKVDPVMERREENAW